MLTLRALQNVPARAVSWPSDPILGLVMILITELKPWQICGCQHCAVAAPRAQGRLCALQQQSL